MADPNEERKLDELLDSALAAYTAAEPRPGLEGRVLAGIRDHMDQPRARWWSVRSLAGAAAVAAMVLVILSILFLRPSQKPAKVQAETPKPAIYEPRPEIPQPESPGMSAKAVPHKQHIHSNQSQQQELAREDRPSVFPTPGPLSEQEKLMLAYVARTPKEELVAQVKGPDPEEEEFWKDRQPAVSRSQR